MPAAFAAASNKWKKRSPGSREVWAKFGWGGKKLVLAGSFLDGSVHHLSWLMVTSFEVLICPAEIASLTQERPSGSFRELTMLLGDKFIAYHCSAVQCTHSMRLLILGSTKKRTVSTSALLTRWPLKQAAGKKPKSLVQRLRSRYRKMIVSFCGTSSCHQCKIMFLQQQREDFLR